MRLHVLFAHYDDGSPEVVGIYTTRDKARAGMEKHAVDNRNGPLEISHKELGGGFVNLNLLVGKTMFTDYWTDIMKVDPDDLSDNPH